ncbi:outer membrane beta-barrel protein [Leeuwenhoekiella sp. MAR_2009_132]|uniref:outer membrane beta-barrel protein n=1 Tax=Leeuwenhoekiella sp. MAR_2009_132 TaxID=1392489 RepID=UPI00048D2DCC|nr:outer membrane beta-barrel protein [Leeuwenhoekiella sp. MAR_2009_132]
MNNRYLLSLVISLISICTFAQDFKITGNLKDGEQKTPLEAATVVLETIKDSTVITYTISDRNGGFELKGRTQLEKANLFVTFVGYESYEREIDISKSSNLDLGTVFLDFQVESLGDVIVKSRTPPVIIKKDTLEFNAASFKTKPDATLEDLLKELPGAEVDESGQIRINGKPVNQILVNGKPFFGDDPTIATRNLTKEIINKIQVVDTKTESEEFAGEEGDADNKTINITIDEDKNKGIFGRVAAGAGTDDRFEYAGLVNYFDNDLRVSVLGGGNNINSPGFSFGEIEKMFGGANYIAFNDNGSFNINGRSFGGGQGVTNSRTAGANLANDFGEKIETSADYFYSAADSFEETNRSRENILPQNRFFSESFSSSNTSTDNHSANMRFQAKIDSTLMIEILPKLRYVEGRNNNFGRSSTRNADGEQVNVSEYNNRGVRTNREFETRLTTTKKYGNGGGFIRANANVSSNDNERDDFLNSQTDVFGNDPQEIDRNQFTDGNDLVKKFNSSVSWRLPIIAKKLFVETKYEYNAERRTNTQLVYGFDATDQLYNEIILPQSTDFKSENTYQRPELGFNYNGEKLNAGLSAGYVMRKLTGEDRLTDENGDRVRDIDFENDFDAVEANANFRYRFNKKMSLWTSYRLNNDAPDVRQLSPYVDVSDPLNTIQGNPNLDPTNRHSFNLGLNNYDWASRTGYYSYFSVNVTNNQVVNQTQVDDNFVRNTTFTNVDGTYNAYASLSYNKDFKLDSLRTLKVELSTYGNLNRFVNFFNADQYASLTKSYTPALGLRFTWKDLFEIRPEYRVSFTETSFNRDFFEGRNFTQHNMRIRTTTYFPKWLTWENDIRYVYNPNVGADFQRDAIFWNTSLAYSFMKDKSLITFKVYDLLDQNTNSRRNATESYVEDVQSTVLQQYFMLSYSYKFNTLGKKGEVRENNWFD